MPIDWNPIKEGSDFNADSLNDRFSGIHGEINELPSSSVEARSLGREHLESAVIIRDREQRTSDFTFSAMRGENGFRFPGWPVSKEYEGGGHKDPGASQASAFSSTRQDSWKVIEQEIFDKPVRFSEAAGDRRPGYVSPFPIQTVEGLLVLVNSYYSQLQAVHTKTSRGAATEQLMGMVAIGLLSHDSSDYFIVPSTIRYIDSDTNTNNGVDVSASEGEDFNIPAGYDSPAKRQIWHLEDIRKDVPIRAYITNYDIPKWSTGVVAEPAEWDAIAVLASIVNQSSAYSENEYRTYLTHAHTDLTVMALHTANTTRITNHWGI